MPSVLQTGHEFTTIFGRNLIAEIPNIAHRPCLVVTMPDLWPKFGHLLGSQCVPYLVRTIDGDELTRELATIPSCSSVVGLGGGQAIDTAKFIAWSRRLPLFQVTPQRRIGDALSPKTLCAHPAAAVPILVL